jgi:DNA-binding CsgD family transcriptional regulator
MMDRNSDPTEAAAAIEMENRQAKVVALYSRGMTQSEIAEKLGVNQSTISRDLQIIRAQARRQLETYLTRDIPFEFHRYMTTTDQIAKKFWEIAEDKETADRNKIVALRLLMDCCSKRIDMLVGGPESGRTAKDHIDSIIEEREDRREQYR